MIFSNAWVTPKPSDYNFTSFHFCVLARIEDTSLPNKGMTYAEGTDVKINVKNNNNIAVHNMVTVYVWPQTDNPPSSIVQLGMRSQDHQVRNYAFEFFSDRTINKHHSGDMSAVLSVTMELGGLYDLWVAGGMMGTYTSKDDVAKTVTFDCGLTPLRLENIALDSGGYYEIKIHFNPIWANFTHDITNKLFHFRQLDSVNNIVGAVHYTVNIMDTIYSGYKTGISPVATLQDGKAAYYLYPNPVSNSCMLQLQSTDNAVANITIVDVVGKTVYTATKIAISAGSPFAFTTEAFSPGTYFVIVTDNLGTAQTLKLIKLK